MEVRDASPGYAPQVEMPVVPESYKQTEVGVIPEEWEVRTLGEVSTFLDGQRRPVKASDRAKMSGTIPYYGASGVVDYINDYLFDEELILLGEDGENILSRNLRLAFRISGKSWVNNHAHVIRPNSDISIGFLTEYLESLDYSGLNSGTAQPKLNKQKCLAIHVAVPPIVEQRAIATALSDVDALLKSLDHLIAKKRDIKQATMQQLLTAQTRLPGFAGEWELKRLDEIADIRSGGTPSTSKAEFWSGSIPWCTPTDITALRGRKYLSLTERTISDGGLRSSSAEVIPPESIIMTTRATIGECAMNTVPMTTNQGFKNLVPTSVDCEYLYYLMTTQKERLIQLCAGSTFLEIGKKQLARFDVYLPEDIGEQRAIAIVLAEMDAELENLQQRRAKTAALKQAMMQELLTGRTRLVEPKEAVAPASDNASQSRGHNWAFNEAVVVSTLSKHFGDERYPVGRKRYTKLAYLLHRHVEREAEGYLKKAAGPYNPQTKYGGPEKIAQQNHYIKRHKGPKGHSGFIAAENIAQAEGYFEKWYGIDTLQWLEQFRFKKNDELELLATVDMAIEELRTSGREVDVAAVKDVIASDPEWKAKLERSMFSDANIADAMSQCEILFGGGGSSDETEGRGPC